MVKGNKLSALVDRNGLPLACTAAPVNVHDSRLYEPTLEVFEIPYVQDRPTTSSQMQPTMPERFVSTIGNEE